jgi:ubiquinone/menaquinone biosynthesis C-methylase UbiE
MEILNREIQWVDPITNESLEMIGNNLISKSSSYSILDGIPNFVVSINDQIQKQVQESFGEKWTQSDFGQDDDEFEKKIKPIYLEMMGLEKNDLNIFNDKIILEVGIGSGSSSRLWGPQAKEFHGVDISKAVYRVPLNLKNLTLNLILSQADINKLPYHDESFDVIVSNGVFHHTPDTKLALRNSLKKLKVGGFCIFYIYKKKSPIREFSDDYVRNQISNLSYNDAWEKMRSITDFGKSLSNQKIEIFIPSDISVLGIKKGKYDLQRFIYDYIFKCFWNDSWGYDYSNLVNIDWYHPKYCWRHTEEEIRSWCHDLDLTVNYIKELESGYACFVIKNSGII